MNIFALITIIFWLPVPLLWIPLHLFPETFRKWGRWTYAVTAMLWIGCVLLMVLNREMLLAYSVKLPRALATFGMVFLFGGIVLHIWTFRLLTFSGITGGHELANRADVLRKDGAFAAVRHPTYLAHTIILIGVFFITRNAAVGIVALLDFVLAWCVIIPLEERELIRRIGPEYAEYQKHVPKFFPKIRL